MREPAFWWRAGDWRSALLTPLAAIYGAVGARRMAQSGKSAGVPVICVGNPTVGGAGKTPLVLALARMLDAARPVLLSRGYGGRLAGPIRVGPGRHRADDVGDEPLLLARVAPTIVARDRVKGAAAAVAAGAGIIVMDDGFQNPSLQKNFSVLVVDARRGLGNGKVLPAGPLRAPLGAQLDRADTLVLVGRSPAEAVIAEKARKRGIPVLHACLQPDAGAAAKLAGHRVLAFAGIGDPEKFFLTLKEAGIVVAATRSFADHHRYSPADARALCQEAERDGLVLVTTEKDLVRLQGDIEVAELAACARALPVTLVLDDEAALARLMQEKISRR
jgi:tetraacyldisaccharide 4'-kinase